MRNFAVWIPALIIKEGRTGIAFPFILNLGCCGDEAAVNPDLTPAIDLGARGEKARSFISILRRLRSIHIYTIPWERDVWIYPDEKKRGYEIWRCRISGGYGRPRLEEIDRDTLTCGLDIPTLPESDVRLPSGSFLRINSCIKLHLFVFRTSFFRRTYRQKHRLSVFFFTRGN